MFHCDSIQRESEVDLKRTEGLRHLWWRYENVPHNSNDSAGQYFMYTMCLSQLLCECLTIIPQTPKSISSSLLEAVWMTVPALISVS